MRMFQIHKHTHSLTNASKQATQVPELSIYQTGITAVIITCKEVSTQTHTHTQRQR